MCGNSIYCSRYSPTLSAMREMCSEHYNRKAQEPRLTSFVANEQAMIKAFQEDRDIYASIASLAFGVPYENCLEFHPITGENQPDGKKRRNEAKTILLGITYGRSVPSIAEQLYNKRDDLSDEEKTKRAQKVYDSVLNAFPNLRKLMLSTQKFAKENGYVTTILGRRRHLPDMQLEEFEFVPMKGYVNPDFDPLDISGTGSQNEIPLAVINQLKEEFAGYKYYGQIAKRIRELYDQHIRVINNRPKINDASRQCLNSIIQGSAADQTKMAILLLEQDEEWKKLGGRLLVPIHDELLVEVPIQNWEKGAEILSNRMIEAADFLPFPSKCDVTTSLRWYGLEYPCKYPKPSVFDTQDEDEVKWIQYHLIEMEYQLPLLPNDDGSPLLGDAAVGINGRRTPELEDCVADYVRTRDISIEDFIECIEHEVVNGNRHFKN